MQVFGNIARSYEVPTFSELVQTGVTGFVPLDAQKAWTVEIGTRGQAGRLGWDIAAYNAWIRDELLGFTVGPDIPAATFNAGDTIHRGIEAGFDAAISDGWFFRGQYTLNDFKFSGDAQYGDNHIAGVPPHVLKAELRYESADGWHVAPNVEYVPIGGWVDHANSLRAPDYAVANLTAGLDLGSDAQVYLDARNLTDRRYVSNYSTITNAATANTNVFYPGEGRSVYVGMKIGF